MKASTSGKAPTSAWSTAPRLGVSQDLADATLASLRGPVDALKAACERVHTDAGASTRELEDLYRSAHEQVKSVHSVATGVVSLLATTVSAARRSAESASAARARSQVRKDLEKRHEEELAKLREENTRLRENETLRRPATSLQGDFSLPPPSGSRSSSAPEPLGSGSGAASPYRDCCLDLAVKLAGVGSEQRSYATSRLAGLAPCLPASDFSDLLSTFMREADQRSGMASAAGHRGGVRDMSQDSLTRSRDRSQGNRTSFEDRLLAGTGLRAPPTVTPDPPMEKMETGDDDL